MTIGDRVKELRTKKGLTQQDLAELLGYKTKSSVAHIEKGRDIPRAMVVKLANILDTTPAYLMGWTEEQKESTSTENDRSAVIKRISDLPDDQFEKLADRLEGYLDGLSEK
jgi:repressor LexA